MLPTMTAVMPAVRILTADDLEGVVDLVTVCEIAENGETDHELVDWIRGARKDHYRLFGIDDADGLAGFALLECERGHVGLEAEIRVRPGLDYSIADPMLTLVREAAARYDATMPVHIMTNSTALHQQRWLLAHGAREIRHFWRMSIDFDDAQLAVPEPPDGVVVRLARDEEADLRQIFSLVDTAFAEHFGHTDERTYETWIDNWRSRQGFDLSLWWVAELDNDPVAALLGMTFPGYGHVGTLGTLKAARGRGIGAHLLRTAFADFHTRGFRKVTLGVDSENGTGAVRLYESVGMKAVNDWPLFEFDPLPKV
jgi:ribosomal protein S18 acetylase RimI-like enzyme